MTVSSGVGGRLDDPQVLALFGREVGVQHEIGHADDAVHRRPDLVAHVGEELALRAVGGLSGISGRSQFLVRPPQLRRLLERMLRQVNGQPDDHRQHPSADEHDNRNQRERTLPRGDQRSPQADDKCGDSDGDADRQPARRASSFHVRLPGPRHHAEPQGAQTGSGMGRHIGRDRPSRRRRSSPAPRPWSPPGQPPRRSTRSVPSRTRREAIELRAGEQRHAGQHETH